MAKPFGILTWALMAWAVGIAPALHMARHAHAEGGEPHACPAVPHGSCGRETPDSAPAPEHDAAHCGICQLAHMPALAAAPIAVSMPETAWMWSLAVSYDSPAVPASRQLPFARGPPA